MKIPSPVGDLGGNCIVTSVALPCKNTTSNPTETRDVQSVDLGNVACVPALRGSVVTKHGYASTALNMGAWTFVPNNEHRGGAYTPEGSLLFGLINYDIDARPVPNRVGQSVMPDNSITINGVRVQADRTQSNRPKS
jgi:hypothetical protein